MTALTRSSQKSSWKITQKSRQKHLGEELVGDGLLSPSESSIISLSVLGLVVVVREPGSAKSGMLIMTFRKSFSLRVTS